MTVVDATIVAEGEAPYFPIRIANCTAGRVLANKGLQSGISPVPRPRAGMNLSDAAHRGLKPRLYGPKPRPKGAAATDRRPRDAQPASEGEMQRKRRFRNGLVIDDGPSGNPSRHRQMPQLG